MLRPGIAPLLRQVGKPPWGFISLNVFKSLNYLVVQAYYLVIQDDLFPGVSSCSSSIKWYTQLSANKPSRSTSRWAVRSSFALVQLKASTARQNPAPPPNFWIFCPGRYFVGKRSRNKLSEASNSCAILYHRPLAVTKCSQDAAQASVSHRAAKFTYIIIRDRADPLAETSALAHSFEMACRRRREAFSSWLETRPRMSLSDSIISCLW